MSYIMAYVLGIMVTFPLLVTIITYLLFHHFTHSKKKSLHRSMEYSALFYLLSSILIFNETFNVSIIGPLTTLLLVLLFMFVIIQWRLIDDIIISRVVRIYLRALFLVFFIAHFVMVMLAIYERVSVYF
ncbi:Protein of unknown function [Pelagirhabdus alkalitolerans]|uniref:DUF3397 domain-containing protein n=1 Tax=Pelagirhabdus alkalitolerans TaxID=1612202 RepID=A0A1G6GZP2_9BACI|nr:DUF3397 domain-containing protein [Pelagirhabdus alkalitolerans]SDB87479.1 Protein of unknown function [Pelagirhabdus alkalitolerans]